MKFISPVSKHWVQLPYSNEGSDTVVNTINETRDMSVSLILCFKGLNANIFKLPSDLLRLERTSQKTLKRIVTLTFFTAMFSGERRHSLRKGMGLG